MRLRVRVLPDTGRTALPLSSRLFTARAERRGFRAGFGLDKADKRPMIGLGGRVPRFEARKLRPTTAEELFTARGPPGSYPRTQPSPTLKRNAHLARFRTPRYRRSPYTQIFPLDKVPDITEFSTVAIFWPYRSKCKSFLSPFGTVVCFMYRGLLHDMHD